MLIALLPATSQCKNVHRSIERNRKRRRTALGIVLSKINMLIF